MSVELWKSIFDWTTVVLIAFTVFCGAGALITGGKINKRQEGELRKFNKDLTDEKALVEGLKADNIRLETKALSLQEKILNMGPRKDLLESGETRQELVDALKPFSSQRIDVRRTAMIGSQNGISMGTKSIADEADGLARALIGVLKDAHWKPPDDVRNCGLGGSGVSVHIFPGALPATLTTAKALVKALGEVPVAADGPDSISHDLAKRTGMEESDKNTILLVVHPR